MDRERRTANLMIVVILFALPGYLVTGVGLANLVVSFYRQAPPDVSSTSPDGAYRVNVTTSVQTMAEILDPAIFVTVELVETASGKSLDSLLVGIDEESDSGEPRIV